MSSAWRRSRYASASLPKANFPFPSSASSASHLDSFGFPQESCKRPKLLPIPPPSGPPLSTTVRSLPKNSTCRIRLVRGRLASVEQRNDNVAYRDFAELKTLRCHSLSRG